MAATQFEIDNALMAGAAYRSTRSSINRFPLPAAWSEIPLSHVVLPSGFEAVSFQRGSEIVISFAGTDFTDFFGDWTEANFPLAFGFASDHLRQAALYYLQVKAANPTATISFTGHSLGGGLAALMGVMFDKRAVTFDQAPFAKSASDGVREDLIDYLKANGYTDATLGALVPELVSFNPYDMGSRVAKVTGYYVQGDVLDVLQDNTRFEILGTQTMLAQSSTGLGLSGPLDLHSQTLLAAFLLSDAFRELTFKLPGLLKTLLDEALYARSTEPGPDAQPNFLDNLIRHQIGVAADPITGAAAIPADAMLDRFVVDLQKVTPDTYGMASGTGMSQALVVAAIEYHYFKDAATATQLFTFDSYGLHFKYSDIGAANYKSLPKLVDAVNAFLTPEEKFLLNGRLVKQDAWHIQSGVGGMVVHAGADNDAMIGGANSDGLWGGGGTDILIGGANDDVLVGEAGNDYLLGGIGFDTYLLNPGDGHDTLLDSDGLGAVWFGDIEAKGSSGLPPEKWVRLGTNNWTDLQNGIVYVLYAVGDGTQNLRISKGDAAATVRNWQPGDLGIEIGDGAAPEVPVTDRLIVGDLAPIDFDPAEPGVQTKTDELDNVIVSGEALPGREDRLNDGAGNDHLMGLDGNDFLYAWRGGDDILEGGAGSDILISQGGADRLYADVRIDDLDLAILLGDTDSGTGLKGELLGSGDGDDLMVGSLGNDTLLGGGGRDVIVGGAGDDNIIGDGYVSMLSGTNYWDVQREVISESWGEGLSVDRHKLNWQGAWAIYFDAVKTSPDSSDIIYAGTGDDWVLAQNGDDFVDAGPGDDVVWGEAGDDIIYGREGNDSLSGDDIDLDGALHGNDFIDGGEGDDVIWGNGGDDTLIGGAGNDFIHGDSNKVFLDPAYAGNDVLVGGDGHDTLVGGGRNDVLYGGEGNDTLVGDDDDPNEQYHGDDYLSGGAGDDQLIGGGGNDVLDGGLGNDYLDGGTGADVMAGGAGDDRYIVDDAGDVVIEAADEGYDSIRSSAASFVLPDHVERITLTGDAAIDATGNADANALFGNAAANRLLGMAGNDQLAGGAGDDFLDGGADDDSLWGGEGNDRLNGGSGFDALSGDAGDDTYVFSLGDSPLSADGYTESIRDNEGVNSLAFGAGIGVDDIQLTQFPGMLQLRYSAGDTLLVMDGLASGVHSVGFSDGGIFELDALYARNSRDAADQTTSEAGARLVGSATDNLLSGSGGGSTFRGGRGDDTLVGDGGGNLYLYERGDGIDHIHDTGGHSAPDGTPAPNRVRFGAGIDRQDVRLAPGADGTLEVLIVGDPSGKLILHNFDADDAAHSSAIDFFDFADGTTLAYADLLGSGFHVEGGAGDDTLQGSNLSDVLLGNAGNDTLYGHGGDDTLAGGEGNDLLIGGTGADLYLYAGGQGRDTIVETDDGSINTLRLEAGLTPDDIDLGADSAQNLLLNIKNTGDTLILANWLASGAALVQRIEFADGTVWTPEWIRQNLTVQSGTADNDVLTALSDQATTLYGLAGNDTLNGSSGNDQLIGGGGNDRLAGGLGNDSYLFETGDGQDILVETGGQDAAVYGAGIAAEDILVSRVGRDLQLAHVNGSDRITIKDWFAYADGRSWVEEIRFADGTVWTAEALTRQALTQVGTDGGDYLYGINDFSDTLLGGDGNDVLYGYSGDDILEGGAGQDALYGGDGNDILSAGPDGGYLDGGAGDDLYLYDAGDGNAAASVNISDSGGNDTLRFGTGIRVEDAQFQRQGQDLRISLADGGQIAIGSWFGYSDYSRIIERFEFSDGAVLTAGELNRILLVQEGTAGNDTLNGTALDDTLIGAAGDDTLRGDAGNDLLHGDPGHDLLYGGDGDDRLYGGEGDDQLVGGAGNDHLDGGIGNDYLAGGAGDDSYLELGLGQDRILDGAGLDKFYFADGILPDQLILTRTQADLRIGFAGRDDSVTLLEWFMRPDSTEAFFFADGRRLSAADINGAFGVISGDGSLAGSAGDDLLYGGAGQDTLQGGTGNDLLNGGAGADSLAGGMGDDTYIADGDDTIVELPGEGVDTLVWTSSESVVLQDELENLVLAESAGGDYWTQATGNAADNRIVGNSQGNRLDGGAGADILEGGLGNDIYYVDNSGDLVIERFNEGNDTVYASVSYALSGHVENLTLTGGDTIDGYGNDLNNYLVGNDAANLLAGGAGNDVLTGGLGADTLAGGYGDDVYYLDGYDDLLVEGYDEGYDRIVINRVSEQQGNTSYVGTFTMAENTESLRMTDWVTNASLYGNAQDNVIDARGSKVFWYQSGYVIWYYQASVDIHAGDGNDTLYASEGGGILDGGAGDDAMYGGPGNDAYYVDSERDRVIEAPSSGTDSVYSSISYTLGADLENLYLLGSADIDGTGNDRGNVLSGNLGNNVLTGGAGNDRLIGGGGNDTLIGGMGDDVYVVSSPDTLIVEHANGGFDRVESSVSYSLAAHIENLTLGYGTAPIDGTGNDLDNRIEGNHGNNQLVGGAGNDILIGWRGNDTMLGGTGDDTYYVDSSRDEVTEYADEGIDTVYSGISYTLGDNLENLVLTGNGAIRGTGNALDNRLTGNAANNTLTGGAGNDWLDGKDGADKMLGGTGNDTYVVDVAADTVTERAGEGIDTVLASVTYTLTRNVENLALTGMDAIDGTGNALDNALKGNDAANSLDGGAGNDTLDGMGGADILIGGKGNDTYVMGRGYGVDTVIENDSAAGNTDIAQFLSGIAVDQIWFSKIANDLEVSIIGTADTMVIQDWYLDTAHRIEQFRTADGRTLLDSQVDNLVSAMASFAPPAAGQTTLPPAYQADLSTAIAVNWQ